MYGVVLMVAMAGGAETPALFNRGCCGCCGTVSYSCCGTSCCGCTGHKTHKWHKAKGCCGTTCCGTSCCGAPVVSCCGTSCCGAPVVSCCGAPAVYAAPAVVHPSVIVPSAPIVPEIKGKEVEKLKKPPVSNETSEAAPALITITVPSEAVVSIDGTVTVSTETTRTFESPTLLAGKSYSYSFKAEFVRDGKNVVVTRNIVVKAGSNINVSLESETAVASR